MADTVADVLLARLREWGIGQVFGYPGDGINGLLAAWGRADNDPTRMREAREVERAKRALAVCTAEEHTVEEDER